MITKLATFLGILGAVFVLAVPATAEDAVNTTNVVNNNNNTAINGNGNEVAIAGKTEIESPKVDIVHPVQLVPVASSGAGSASGAASSAAAAASAAAGSGAGSAASSSASASSSAAADSQNGAVLLSVPKKPVSVSSAENTTNVVNNNNNTAINGNGNEVAIANKTEIENEKGGISYGGGKGSNETNVVNKNNNTAINGNGNAVAISDKTTIGKKTETGKEEKVVAAAKAAQAEKVVEKVVEKAAVTPPVETKGGLPPKGPLPETGAELLVPGLVGLAGAAGYSFRKILAARALI